MEIEIKIVKKIDRKDFIRLNKEAGWWKEEYSKDLSFIDGMVKNAFCFAGAFCGNRLVGMGRSISDRVSDAYIQDVAVLKKFRRQGTGKKIILKIIEYLEKHNIEWIGVVAEPGTQSFYEDLGFKTLKKYKPMLFAAKASENCHSRAGGNPKL